MESSATKRHGVGGKSTAEVEEAFLGDGRNDTRRVPSGPADDLEPRESGELPALHRGMEVGRYIVLDALGEGGMGSVHAAWDPKLSRRLAIKIMKVRTDDSGLRRTVRERLLREAQALGQLSHPNVVTIYDVGTYGQDVYLALEHVKGRTLRQWAREELRPISEILEAYVAAARGLAAAHAAGIVHRDFKPANVILGEDGRVRVLDFGLACLANGAPVGAETQLASSTQPSSDDLDSDVGVSPEESRLTEAGRAMGTPVYMSPEQHRGEAIDAKSDQFSFCVSLYESLYGRRPFTARSYPTFRRRVLMGAVDDPPPDTRVPKWLRSVLLRGLSVEPSERYRDMNALIDALHDDPAIRKRRWILGGAGVLGLGTVAGVGVWIGSESAGPGCDGAREHLRSVSSSEALDGLERAFLATEHVSAKDTAVRVSRIVEEYGETWASSYADACEATHVRGEQSHEMLDVRMRCLLRSRDQMASLVELYRNGPEPDDLHEAVAAVTELGRLESCEPDDLVDDAPVEQLDGRALERHATISRQLDEAEVFDAAGRYTDGLAVAQVAVDAAKDLGSSGLLARALLQRGDLEERSGQWEDARRDFARAMDVAGEAGDPELMARAAVAQMFVTGYQLSKPDAALELEPVASGLISLAEADEVRPLLHRAIGAAHMNRGDFPAARAAFAGYLEALRARLGDDHLQTIGALNNLGAVHLAERHFAEACEAFDRAVDVTTQALGSTHTSLFGLLVNQSMCLDGLERYEDAESVARRALDLELQTQGDRGPGVWRARYVLASTLANAGRHEEALDEFTLALALQETLLGPSHPTLVGSLDGIGNALLALDRFEEAEQALERAHRLGIEVLGPDHADLTFILYSLAKLARARGHEAVAVDRFLRASEHASRSLGAQHAAVADGLWAAADLLEPEQDARAIELLERAMRLLEAVGDDPAIAVDLARVRFAMAQRLLRVGMTPRARRMARMARDFYASYPDRWPEEQERLRAWLEAHDARD